MTKEEIFKQFNVKSLEEVSDSEIIKLALDEKLGQWTAVSARSGSWCFETEKELADHIRKAVSIGKDIRVQYEWSEGYLGGDKIVVDFIESKQLN